MQHFSNWILQELLSWQKKSPMAHSSGNANPEQTTTGTHVREWLTQTPCGIWRFLTGIYPGTITMEETFWSQEWRQCYQERGTPARGTPHQLTWGHEHPPQGGQTHPIPAPPLRGSGEFHQGFGFWCFFFFNENNSLNLYCKLTEKSDSSYRKTAFHVNRSIL